MVCSGSSRLKHGQLADSAPRLYDSIKKAEYLCILFKKNVCVFWMICLWTLIILYLSLFLNAPFLPSAPTSKKQENKMPENKMPVKGQRVSVLTQSSMVGRAQRALRWGVQSPLRVWSCKSSLLTSPPHLQLQGHPWGRKGVQHFDGAPGVQSHHESLLSRGLCPC